MLHIFDRKVDCVDRRASKSRSLPWSNAWCNYVNSQQRFKKWMTCSSQGNLQRQLHILTISLSLKPGLLACEYKIPFKNHLTADWKLTYMLKQAKTLSAELISSSDRCDFHCQEPHGLLLLRVPRGSFRNLTRPPLHYHLWMSSCVYLGIWC